MQKPVIHEFVYFRLFMPDGPWQRRWQRSYLRLNGFRLGVLARADVSWGIHWNWRWSWRGVEIDIGPWRIFTGWMARQLREAN